MEPVQAADMLGRMGPNRDERKEEVPLPEHADEHTCMSTLPSAPSSTMNEQQPVHPPPADERDQEVLLMQQQLARLLVPVLQPDGTPAPTERQKAAARAAIAREMRRSSLRKPPSWPSPTAGPRLWGPGSGRLSSASLSAIATASAYAATGPTDESVITASSRTGSQHTLVLTPTPTGPAVSCVNVEQSSALILQPVASRLQRRIDALEKELALSKSASDGTLGGTSANVPYHPRLHGSPSEPDFFTSSAAPHQPYRFQQQQMQKHQSWANEQSAKQGHERQKPAQLSRNNSSSKDDQPNARGAQQSSGTSMPTATPERRPYDTWQFQQFINPPVTPAVRPKLTRQQRERLEERRRAKAKLSILQWRNEQERFGERWYSDPNNFRGPARQSRGALHAPPVYRQPPLRPSTMLSRA